MSFSIEQLEFYLYILIRISTFIYTGPFLSLKYVPQRVKIGFSMSLALLLFEALPYQAPVYTTVIDFAIIILNEALAGLIMGFFANAAYHILAFVGHMIDSEMGFSMVSQFDQISGIQVTVTANLYSYIVMAMLLITKMHIFIISTFVDSFMYIPVGEAFINPVMYEGFLNFVVDYFVIGFRIALPMFAAILIVNVILAVLAKAAPQMNMFVVGIQIKVLVGITVLVLMVGMIESISDFIYNNMDDMLKAAMRYLRSPF